jgi:hypothetical protein
MSNQFKRSFSQARLHTLGKVTRFCQRERVVTPQRLALTMIDAFGTKPLDGIADLHRAFNKLCEQKIHYKPFWDQLSKPQFPVFMKELLSHLVNDLAVEVLRFDAKSPFARFRHIRLQDGTSFALKDGLAKRFPGRFTKVSPAAVELHVNLDLLTETLHSVWLSPDCEAERHFLPTPEALAGDLLLADRGYFDKHYCRETFNAQGSYIIRGKSDLNPLILRAYDAQGKEIKSWRNQRLKAVTSKIARRSTVDLDVQFEAKGSPMTCRIIANPNPREGVPRYLVTNLSRFAFSPEHISDGYRLRWQIELLFKEWKSHLQLKRFGTENEHIAEGLIWAALCTAALSRYCAHMTQRLTSKPISTRRTAMCLPYVLTPIIEALLYTLSTLHAAIKQAVDYLSNNAQRAHPKRDAKQGRLKLNLKHVYGVS